MGSAVLLSAEFFSRSNPAANPELSARSAADIAPTSAASFALS
jgi:hypothetical protein